MQAEVPGFRTDFLVQGRPVGVAVSGGADSIALLHLLRTWRADLIVLHLNYRLRGAESDGDEQFVSQKSAELGLRCIVDRPHLDCGNLEQAARLARYSWFAKLVQDGIVGQVATGHTRDDQAETVLFRFLRGAGTAGLAAILPQTSQGIIRPLLNSSRVDIRNYLAHRNLTWREDSSNNSVRFGRNRIRHTLLPDLEQNWNPKIAATLAQTAEWARGEEEYWEAELPRVSENWLRFCERGAIFEVDGLNGVPLALARRAVRWAVRWVNGFTIPDFDHVERVLRLAQASRGLGSFRTASWEAIRSFGMLKISGPSAKPDNYSKILNIPGACLVPNGSSELLLELKPVESVYNSGGQLVDWSLVRGTLELRNWLPGDRFQQEGQSTALKLKHYFQEAGIPSWERSGWPVITHDNSILWTRGQGVSAAYTPTVATTIVLQIVEIPKNVCGRMPNQKVYN